MTLHAIKKRLPSDPGAVASLKDLLGHQNCPTLELLEGARLITKHALIPETGRVNMLGHLTGDFLAQCLTAVAWARDLPCRVNPNEFGTLPQQLLQGRHESDDDVALNLVMLEASGLIDMGHHFPDRDREWSELMASLSAFVSSRSSPVVILLPELPLDLPGADQRRSVHRAWTDAIRDATRDAGGHIELSFLQASLGHAAWLDPIAYSTSRLPCSLEAHAHVARGICDAWEAVRTPKKCLVLDLDNTLWGGLAGEIPASELKLGPEDPVSRSFLDFQKTVLYLKSRGIILAACSKNDESVALAALRDHPFNLLKPDQFSTHRINWDPKSQNIRSMAEELNLPLDAFMFVDDSAMEIAEVSSSLPEVTCVHLPEDPALFARTLAESVSLPPTTLTQEDRTRTDLYRAESARKSLQENHGGSYDDFLQSLEMVCRIDNIDDHNIERVAQLFQKTNQFNFTTRRHSAQKILEFASSPRSWCRALTLEDRLGSYGLVGVLLATPASDEELEIESFLLSCRVFKRGVEDVLMNRLCAWARDNAFTSLSLQLIHTKKNGLLRGLPARYAFEIEREDPHRIAFRLPLESFTDVPCHIDDH